ncbi:MAG TPA: hypothetical protein PKK43_02780 [Spirochaetota bacterium]|nr:hypothetical protein [Spirochaetota bacterium]
MDATFSALGTKPTFNKALRHFFKVSELVDVVEEKKNLADVLCGEIEDQEVARDQVLPIIGSLLRDKFGYSYDSFDIPSNISDFKKIITETGKWTALDMVLVYFNPNGQVFLINPANEEHWGIVGDLVRDQLAVIYVKYLKNDEGDSKIEKDAINAIEEMLAGKDVFINKAFVDSSVSSRLQPKKAAPAPVARQGGAAPAPIGKRQVTPKYSVQVSNELFHNGNVEAWKRIIESYKSVHPNVEVVIVYEDEVINDINSLFKWGKVKHGGLIFIQLVGEDIKNVSKLLKYLFEGASQRYEQFLHGSVGSVLNLF